MRVGYNEVVGSWRHFFATTCTIPASCRVIRVSFGPFHVFLLLPIYLIHLLNVCYFPMGVVRLLDSQLPAPLALIVQ